jgi:hypothetical protein
VCLTFILKLILEEETQYLPLTEKGLRFGFWLGGRLRIWTYPEFVDTELSSILEG